jgi:hypothetical protein
MARITKAEQSLIPTIGLLAGRQLLERLSQDELSDRVHYAHDLMAKAAATKDPTIKQGYNRLAGAVLQAPMLRDDAENQARDLLTKAQLTRAVPIADQLRAQAQRLLEDNPVAPRRQQAVRRALQKAANEGQVAVYDAAGNLVGTCDPAKITQLIDPKTINGTGDTQTPQAGPGAAAKAMSAGAEASGQKQLGGPNPPGGVPVVDAEDDDAPVAKAQANARRLVGVMTRPRR